MKARPYVGVTGLTTVEETKNVCNLFHRAGYGLDNPHLPMIGFLVSYKTLNQEETKNRRYPAIKSLDSLLKEAQGKVFTTIHYNTKETDTLAIQIKKIFEGIYEENLCRGLQLNIPWPKITEVEEIKDKYPEMKIIFQASKKMLIEYDPKDIARRISQYGKLLDYCLIDPSGGNGEPFDLDKSASIYFATNKRCPNLTIGFAGGLNGDFIKEKVNYLNSVIGHNNFSIDSEGGLRNKLSDQYGDDLLNLEKIKLYLENCPLV
jgi:phosphoribosylanthranilate isomerase